VQVADDRAAGFAACSCDDDSHLTAHSAVR
jgi:hypothetical protein